MSTLFLLRGIQTERRGPYVAYAVGASLGVYTHLTMVFLVLSHVLICTGLALTDWQRGSPAPRWKLPLQAFLLTGALTLLFYAPILIQVPRFFLESATRHQRHRDSGLGISGVPSEV